MSTIDLTQFHAIFFAESAESLSGMESALLRIERDSWEPERLNEIFRAVHSIKGSGGSLGFEAIAGFSHRLEELLDQVRKGRHEPDSAMVDLLLAAVDCLRALLAAAEGGVEPDLQRVAELQSLLAQWEQEQGAAAPPPAAVPAEAAGGTAVRYLIAFRPHREFFHSGNDPLRLFRALAALGEFEVEADSAALPGFADFDPEQCYLAWRISLTTDAAQEDIAEIFDWVSECSDLAIEPASPAAPAPRERRHGARRQEDYEPAAGFRANSLHVNAEKVDELVNLVSELVITHTMLKQIATRFDMSRLSRLETTLALLERNTRDLQHQVMSIRMLPVSFAFGRFERMVRDVSQQLGKQVRLRISGEQSELDKTVIEKLIDPLTHLVRNALDHGIETPAERAGLGKPETALLSLHAEHKGGNILIEVRDDGRGIDGEKVRARAVQQGLIDAGEDLDADQAARLILLPGFSTATEVSDLSGRGVGLDVVSRNIAELGGSLQVGSRPDRGTTVTILLPLTLAIVDGMSISLGGETYIVPMRFIVECLQPEEGAVNSVAGRGRVVEVRGDYVPILDLRRICGIAPAPQPGQELLLLVEAEGRKVALPVDAMLGQDQVVIKSLETHYRKLRHFAGATILGDGRVALILDVNALVRSATR